MGGEGKRRVEKREGRRAVKRESGNWGLRGSRRGRERER